MTLSVAEHVKNMLDLYDGLVGQGDNKINAIKYARSAFSLGLRDAKEFVEAIVNRRITMGQHPVDLANFAAGYLNTNFYSHQKAVPPVEKLTDMTKREIFAAFAMQGLLASGAHVSYTDYVYQQVREASFKYADEMLKGDPK
jgi:hypothetical protein